MLTGHVAQRGGAQIRSNNPIERLPARSAVAPTSGIFPDRPSVFRLVGAILAEQHDESAEGRRYLGLDVIISAQELAATVDEEVTNELTIQAITT